MVLWYAGFMNLMLEVWIQGCMLSGFQVTIDWLKELVEVLVDRDSQFQMTIWVGF